jgi:hypothetical protein
MVSKNFFARLRRALWFGMLALPIAASAQTKAGSGNSATAGNSAGGGVFRCTDAEGKVEYRNVGDTKGCKKIETEAVNTVPFPRPAAKPSPEAKVGARVDNGAQRSRDNDRRRILEDEMASEQKRLTELKAEYNNGEPERRGDERNFQRYTDRVEKLKADISRSEANVESLRRELGTVRN